MKINPIYKREVMVSSRGVKLALVLLIFNGVLAVAALVNMYTAIAQVRLTAEMQYSSFLELYFFVATIEFVLLLFLVPAMTAGSISRERERQTLDLMLITKMSYFDIVIGKLAASLTTMFILVISSFPVLSLVFIYGGITIQDLFMLMLCYVSTALFVGSMGICLSALFKRSILSMVVSYAILAVIVFGTYGINYFIMLLTRMQSDHYAAAIGVPAMQENAKGIVYLLLVNPAVTYLITMKQQIGSNNTLDLLNQWFGAMNMDPIIRNWTVFSIVLQLSLSIVFLIIAVRVIDPIRNKKFHIR